jgi:16S rRNA (cytosine1402-N4)-methyltransferase
LLSNDYWLKKKIHVFNSYHFRLLKSGGILLCISFHSLEDRIIKRHFQGIVLHPDEFNSNLDEKSLRNEAEKQIRYNIQTKNIIQADDMELNENPKSRSAKLRYAIKL